MILENTPLLCSCNKTDCFRIAVLLTETAKKASNSTLISREVSFRKELLSTLLFKILMTFLFSLGQDKMFISIFLWTLKDFKKATGFCRRKRIDCCKVIV